MPRYKTFEDLVKAYENAGYEIILKQENKCRLGKDVVIDREVCPGLLNAVSVVVTNLITSVETETIFPRIRRSGNRGIVVKTFSHKYKKTPEGLVPATYEFEDRGTRKLPGNLISCPVMTR